MLYTQLVKKMYKLVCKLGLICVNYESFVFALLLVFFLFVGFIF
jgi:hypothetical protein